MLILNLILPLFIIILFSYFLKKRRFFNDSFISTLNRFIFYIALPLYLFKLTSSMEVMSLLTLNTLTGLPLVLVLMTLLAVPWAFLFFKKRDRATFIQGAYRSNLNYMGIPVIIAYLGEETGGLVSFVSVTGSVVNTVLAVIVFNLFRSEGPGAVKFKPGNIFLNPLIVAIGTGFLFSLAGFELPGFFKNTLALISRTTLPLVLLIMGFSLSLGEIKKYLVKNLIAGFFKLILMPLLAFLVMTYFFRAEETLLYVVVLMAGMPTAITSITFAREYGGEPGFASSLVNFTIILSMLTIPLITWLLSLRG